MVITTTDSHITAPTPPSKMGWDEMGVQDGMDYVPSYTTYSALSRVDYVSSYTTDSALSYTTYYALSYVTDSAPSWGRFTDSAPP